MDRVVVRTAIYTLIGLLPIFSIAQDAKSQQWIGTWATAPQPAMPGEVETFRNQTLRLIVHTSAGGRKIRIKISNTFGDHPLVIGAAHVARRTTGADIDPTSDRTLTFRGQSSTAVPAGSTVVSDPVGLEVPALSDLAISYFLRESTQVKTAHVLAKQTSYVSATGDFTGQVKFPVAKNIHTWPFLTGIDIGASGRGVAVVAFGSSLTDGDGTESDTNERWPDVLARRLQESGGEHVEMGVLNEGIIGNRLLDDSPLEAAGGQFGAVLGQAGVTRFGRDVLAQSGAKYVIVGLGINDIAMPGSLTPTAESIDAESIIAGLRLLISRAHQRRIRIIGTTNPPFENSFLQLDARLPPVTFYTPEKEEVRQKVNAWILSSNEFDGVVDFDAVLRDPSHRTQLLPAYDSGDHLHPNNAGCRAEGNAVPLALFERN